MFQWLRRESQSYNITYLYFGTQAIHRYRKDEVKKKECTLMIDSSYTSSDTCSNTCHVMKCTVQYLKVMGLDQSRVELGVCSTSV